MPYLIDGEVADTYGGDFTWYYVWYEVEDGQYIFYEQYIGAKPKSPSIVSDENEIKEFMSMIESNTIDDK